MRISDVSSDVCSSDLPPIRVDAIPGRAYRYSGGGYLIVQQLMQDTTGRSFGDLMHEEVLDRAQMASSTFKQSLPSGLGIIARSEEHTSELQSLMRISYAVFCLNKKTNNSPSHRKRQQQT